MGIHQTSLSALFLSFESLALLRFLPFLPDVISLQLQAFSMMLVYSADVGSCLCVL